MKNQSELKVPQTPRPNRRELLEQWKQSKMRPETPRKPQTETPKNIKFEDMLRTTPINPPKTPVDNRRIGSQTCRGKAPFNTMSVRKLTGAAGFGQMDFHFNPKLSSGERQALERSFNLEMNSSNIKSIKRQITNDKAMTEMSKVRRSITQDMKFEGKASAGMKTLMSKSKQELNDFLALKHPIKTKEQIDKENKQKEQIKMNKIEVESEMVLEPLCELKNGRELSMSTNPEIQEEKVEEKKDIINEFEIKQNDMVHDVLNKEIGDINTNKIIEETQVTNEIKEEKIKEDIQTKTVPEDDKIIQEIQEEVQPEIKNDDKNTMCEEPIVSQENSCDREKRDIETENMNQETKAENYCEDQVKKEETNVDLEKDNSETTIACEIEQDNDNKETKIIEETNEEQKNHEQETNMENNPSNSNKMIEEKLEPEKPQETQIQIEKESEESILENLVPVVLIEETSISYEFNTKVSVSKKRKHDEYEAVDGKMSLSKGKRSYKKMHFNENPSEAQITAPQEKIKIELPPKQKVNASKRKSSVAPSVKDQRDDYGSELVFSIIEKKKGKNEVEQMIAPLRRSMRLSNVTKTSPVKTWNKENSKRKLKIDLSQSGLVNDAIKFLGEDIMPSLNDSTGSNKNIEEGAMKTRSRSRKAAACSKSSVNKGGIN